MKKCIILLSLILLLTGCININKSSYETIINEVLTSKVNIYNQYRDGYKYYLPHGLYVSTSKEYNELIKSERYNYYLYIDVISYLNQVKNKYKENSSSNYSFLINSGDKSGYLEINEEKDKYLVEIMYNYAKIEVIVEEKDIKKAISNAIIILSSIHYNDSVLNSINEANILSYGDEAIDIFNSKSGSDASNFLEYIEEYDPVDEEVADYDLIK